jgi:protein arginine N-methyltransferase 3
MLSVAEGTKVSFPTCMMCSQEQKTTTRSPLISVLSVLAYDVYTEAIIYIVSPDSLASRPYLLNDLHLKSTTPCNLNFSSPFTLTSTTPKRTKIHAFVLYFDTFFTTTGNTVSPFVPVKVTKEVDVTLAEVWPVGGQPPPQRWASVGAGLKQKEDRRMTSFSTGPDSLPTHWKQTVFVEGADAR